MVVIEGPRFSTKAESRMYAQLGADVIGMTQFPEAPLARELELCFGNVALVTDYDVGVDDIPPVTHEEVLKVFGENIDKLRDLLFAAIPEVPAERTCPCATALAGTGTRMMAGGRSSPSSCGSPPTRTRGSSPIGCARRSRRSSARTSLEEFRVKTLPLDGPNERGLRPVE